MIELSRRSVLLGTGAVALASGTGQAVTAGKAEAAAPAAQTQAPGFYRSKLGDFVLTQFSDGARTFPVSDSFVKNAPKASVLAAAEAAHMPQGQVTIPFNPILINTGSKLVLIDTGYGPGAASPVGRLVPNMAAAGVDPKSIDIVVLSHLHPDHINGIKAADGSLVYPNAEIKAPAVDVGFWMSEENATKAKDDTTKNYFGNCRKTLGNVVDKITRYDWGKEVAPGITALETPGHTPGHTSFAVSSGSATMLVQSDVTNIPELFALHPDWHSMYDYDPDKAVQTRRKFYDMAISEKSLIAGFHFSFPSM